MGWQISTMESVSERGWRCLYMWQFPRMYMLQTKNGLLCHPYLQLLSNALFRYSTVRLTMVRLTRWLKGGITLNCPVSGRKGKLITPYVLVKDALYSLYLILVLPVNCPAIHNHRNYNLTYIYSYTIIVIYIAYTLFCSCL